MAAVSVLLSPTYAADKKEARGKQVVILKPTLHQYEDGPPVPGGYEFFTGDTVFLSFQVAGYSATEKDKIRLTYQIDAFDAGGVRLIQTAHGKVEAELAPQDKEWMPKVRYNVLVPPSADSGVYRLAIVVNDELNGSSAKQEVNFNVRGHYVEPSDQLVVRNFRFLRSEQATEPLAVAAYRPGDSVWARFDITGYRFGERNRFSVDYGLSVLRASGKVLYTEPKAAEEEHESFYPHRYVPGVLSLSLTPDLAKGEYTIVLTVRDNIGQQTNETRHTFQVE
jgi:hypothetical protein